MALCIVMMCCRLGAVIGGFFAKTILESHCQTIFYIDSALLVGQYLLMIENRQAYNSVLNLVLLSCWYCCIFSAGRKKGNYLK